MKKHIVAFGSIALLTSALMGCANGYGYGVTPRTAGTVIGGVGGGVIGSAVSRGNPVATVAGAVGGALIGNEIGGQYQRRHYY